MPSLLIFPSSMTKDNTLAFWFSIQSEQNVDHGRGYIKILSGDVKQKKFGWDMLKNVSCKELDLLYTSSLVVSIVFFFLKQTQSKQKK